MILSRPCIGLFLALVLVSCAPIPHYETLTSRVSGNVIDQVGRPVSGASVRYQFRGRRILGETTTSDDGSFTLGPYRQWFYLLYIGSPGVAPFPYTLEGGYGHPDTLHITRDASSAYYLLDTHEHFISIKRSPYAPKIDLPSPQRWIPTSGRYLLSPHMNDTINPSQTPPPLRTSRYRQP
jgi:hypothetical protein